MNSWQPYRQLIENLSALGTRRLVALGVIGMTVFVSIGLGSYLVARSDYQPIYIGVSLTDANRMAAALTELAIPFDISADGTKVSVPSAAVARARAALAERGLPSSGDTGYELFDKIGPLGLTTFMQEVSRVRALEGEITRTLASMSGVVAARVHLVLGDKGPIQKKAHTPSASVVLKLGIAADRAPVDAIRHVVAAAVPGMVTGSIRIVSTEGAVLAAGDDGAKPGAGRMFDLERALQSQLRENLAATLTPVLGAQNFQSSVALRLSADQSIINENIFDPNSKVERQVRVVKEAGNSKDGSDAQNVSVEQNLPQVKDAASGGRQSQKANQRRDETTSYEISSKTVSTTRDGYKIDRLSIALVVNRASLKSAEGKPLDDAAFAARIAEIEKLAASAVGLDASRGDALTVAAREFLPVEATAIDEPAGGIEAALNGIAVTIATIVASALAAVGVLWFGARPLLKLVLERPADAALPALAAAAPSVGSVPASARKETIDPVPLPQIGSDAAEQPSIAPMVAKLNKLITDDPEQAVAVFRRWIRTEGA
ncbi:MAG: flagellar basal-body MS-ring/collar protein FliF [Hyphomicrobium sp.]|nr:flagellar basal-body MS-ring/collar protein FliF [Hyphomicrobium sp.]